MDITLQRILEEMKLQNKKKKDLTVYLNVVNSTFGNWISGRNSSYKKYLHAIADYLNVSVEYLKGETDIKQKEKPLGVKELTVFNYEGVEGANTVKVNLNNLQQISDLVNELRDMPADKIEAITQLIKSMKE